MRRALGIVCVVVLALGGCGAGDEEQIRGVMQDWKEAFLSGDGERACELMTGEARREIARSGLGASGCAEAMRTARGYFDRGELAQLEEMEVRSVRVTGSTAEARSSLDGDDGSPTRLRKVEGDWLIDSDE